MGSDREHVAYCETEYLVDAGRRTALNIAQGGVGNVEVRVPLGLSNGAARALKRRKSNQFALAETRP
jgi:hypothetical protein